MPINTEATIIAKAQENTPLATLPREILDLVTQEFSAQDLSRLSQTCTLFYTFFPQETMKTIKLQLAVLDGDIPVIKNILDVEPDLLLKEPKRKNVIKSKLTWKKVFGEIPFTMALKTRQNKVIEAMLPYLSKIDNGHQNALALWRAFERLPVKAPHDFKSLIDVIARETFPNGEKGQLSDRTLQALIAFENSVKPQEAIALQDDYNLLEHLFLATKACREELKRFGTSQHLLYVIQVIAELQSVLQREHAQVHCYGLFRVVEDNKEPNSERAENLKMNGNVDFYRAGSLQGLGVDCFCSGFGDPDFYASRWLDGRQQANLQKYLKKTQRISGALKASLIEAARLNENANRGACV